ncbi:UDP-N-acetylmuramyl pentapeptide phosphotransferase/UDP-N-acetylglucosamine-1-phosphate transferase [Desulfosporosinus orientis DSM 765]|uniref:UDP-N-acetylmuramyl pentapeptide phosphotransferase/UDP-N-acetylglucosamine-1-phosphate transferase n=1 Tax=Desulfosporosinus orientis (strain ATCC 19365 / DSM 765 / NCIMB 8382 / VKM B-1628 / Singapore I) TaxID=768706 RepID=G7WIN5_DESOD|nr:MraY family glycosyltransferase [Desulfosporosinus orientis]AET69109.1 UDP-N-acetylmuramyl pentapeptide phosphotransferase/UDP-N-acetylglucosamine-1-phosphate transferase [Desulfosporosinus orientis DSM 765]
MMKGYGLTFLLALVIAVIATPISMKLAKIWGAIAYPGGRHIHSRPIPRLGGLAIYAAFWLSAFVTQVWDKNTWGLFIGSTIILAVGVWDDIHEIRPLYKLYWQIAAAAVLIAYGFSMNFISLPFLDYPIVFKNMGLTAVGLLLMLFWVVGLVNTVNVSDGMDGLAGGICFMVALLLFWSANGINQVPAANLTLALAGALLGFLFFNFPPARVFMGDSGSMFLGYIIGGVSIMGLLKTATILGLVFPLLVLGMPVTDLTFAIIRRKLRGQSIAMADRGHLHHRLLDAGYTQRQAVLVMYGISACFGLAAVLGAKGFWIGAVVILSVAFALLITILMRRTEKLVVFGRRHSK